MTTSNFATYLDRNEAFASSAPGELPEIPFVPTRQLYLITCIDPRVDPAGIAGALLGEAIVARNVGGRVTPALIKDLAWIVHLHENLTPDADWFELAVIHHTDCGSGLLADDELRHGYAERGGWDEAELADLAVTEPAVTVVKDIERLRRAPELQPAIQRVAIGGYVYDVDTRRLTTVVAPSERASA